MVWLESDLSRNYPFEESFESSKKKGFLLDRHELRRHSFLGIGHIAATSSQTFYVTTTLFPFLGSRTVIGFEEALCVETSHRLEREHLLAVDLKLLQIVSKSDNERCASKTLALKGVDCEILHRLER
ncbi:hypothetical protein SDJN02_22111, partial [Cucurbita argyrosperma subsp. argyrosperma]